MICRPSRRRYPEPDFASHPLQSPCHFRRLTLAAGAGLGLCGLCQQSLAIAFCRQAWPTTGAVTGGSTLASSGAGSRRGFASSGRQLAHRDWGVAAFALCRAFGGGALHAGPTAATAATGWGWQYETHKLCWGQRLGWSAGGGKAQAAEQEVSLLRPAHAEWLDTASGTFVERSARGPFAELASHDAGRGRPAGPWCARTARTASSCGTK